jgi:hypothetical protein
MPFWNRFTGTSVKAIAVAYSSEVVVYQGSVPEKLFMLREGCLVTCVSNHKGNEVKVDELSQRDSFETKRYLWVVLQEAVRQAPSATTTKS